MRRRWQPTRRHLLRAAMLLGALGLPMGGRLRAASTTQDATAARLLSLLRHRTSARRIGERYLRVAPDEASAARLVDLICDDVMPDRARLAAVDDATLRRRLRSRVQQDFARNRTVRVAGWILSATEARLCALAALV